MVLVCWSNNKYEKGKDWVYALWNSSKSEEQKFDYRKQQQGGIKYSHIQLSWPKTRPIAIPSWTDRHYI